MKNNDFSFLVLFPSGKRSKWVNGLKKKKNRTKQNKQKLSFKWAAMLGYSLISATTVLGLPRLGEEELAPCVSSENKTNELAPC